MKKNKELCKDGEGLKKTKYLMAKTGKERKEIVQENVKSGTVWKTETYQQLRITINDEGNLKEHIKMITERSNK